MTKKSRITLCFCIIAILLSGCWDTIDIEKRGFVLGIAIDMPEKDTEEGKEFLITNQVVVPSQVAGQSDNENSGGDGQAYYNISKEGRSIYKTTEEFAGSSSKVPYYEHLILTVLSTEIAEQENILTIVLDSLIRSPYIRRNINLIVTEDKAKDILDVTTPDEPLPVMHLQELLQQSKKRSGFFPAKSLDDIAELIFQQRSFVLPLLTEVRNYIDYQNGAVFQGGKKRMVGRFDKEEMSGLSLFRDKAKGHIFTFDYNEDSMSFLVVKQTNQFKLDTSDINHVKVKLDIELEGGIRETYTNVNLDEGLVIRDIEKAAAKRVENLVKKTIEKGQKEFNADVFRIWSLLETKHYDTWKKVRDDWETGQNHFSDVIIDVDATVALYSTGTSNKTD